MRYDYVALWYYTKRDIEKIVVRIQKTVHRRITEGTQQRKESIRKTLAQVQKTQDLVKVA